MRDDAECFAPVPLPAAAPPEDRCLCDLDPEPAVLLRVRRRGVARVVVVRGTASLHEAMAAAERRGLVRIGDHVMVQPCPPGEVVGAHEIDVSEQEHEVWPMAVSAGAS